MDNKFRKCEKCGRELLKHKTDIITLPITSDHDLDTKNKVSSVEMYYCKVCDKFKTELIK